MSAPRRAVRRVVGVAFDSVAGDETPKGTVSDERNRCRGAHTHIAQILKMDQEKRFSALISLVLQRPCFLRRWAEGAGICVDIEDDPYPFLAMSARAC